MYFFFSFLECIVVISFFTWLIFLFCQRFRSFCLKGLGLGACVTSGPNLFAQLWSNSGFLCEQVTHCSFPLTCDPTVAPVTHCDTVT